MSGLALYPDMVVEPSADTWEEWVASLTECGDDMYPMELIGAFDVTCQATRTSDHAHIIHTRFVGDGAECWHVHHEWRGDILYLSSFAAALEEADSCISVPF